MQRRSRSSQQRVQCLHQAGFPSALHGKKREVSKTGNPDRRRRRRSPCPQQPFRRHHRGTSTGRQVWSSSAIFFFNLDLTLSNLRQAKRHVRSERTAQNNKSSSSCLPEMIFNFERKYSRTIATMTIPAVPKIDAGLEEDGECHPDPLFQQ